MEEFMSAMKDVFPKLLVQFEDFSTDNAFKYLDVFRDRYIVFNDDVSNQPSTVNFADPVRFSDSRHWRCNTIWFHKRCSSRVRRLWLAVNGPQNTFLWCWFSWYRCRQTTVVVLYHSWPQPGRSQEAHICEIN